MKLSHAMEQALLGSTTVGRKREIMSAGPATKRGLARRLLVEPGTWKLTEAGEAERKRLIGELPRVAKSTTTLPAMKRINVTPKMADALGTTIEINGERAMIMSSPKTQAALAKRGLATEHGYLTDQGRFLAWMISMDPASRTRSWSWSTIEAGTRTWLRDQKRHAATTILEDVELDSDEADRRDAARVASTTTLPIADGMGQPVPVYGHRKLDGAIDPATTPLGRPVGDFQVKIWYASGSSEVISHIDFMSAAAIYSEALDRERAIAAEVHCPGGCLAATFTRQVDSTGNRG